MTTMEQVVIQLQEELFTLKAQVAARVQIAAATQQDCWPQPKLEKMLRVSSM